VSHPRQADIEGEAPQASPVEGATLANDTRAQRVFEGEAPQASPVEGATLAL